MDGGSSRVSFFLLPAHLYTPYNIPSVTVVGRTTYTCTRIIHSIYYYIYIGIYILYVYTHLSFLLRNGRERGVGRDQQVETYMLYVYNIYVYVYRYARKRLPSTELWLRWLVLSHPFPRQPNPKGTKGQAESSKPLFILNIQFLSVFFVSFILYLSSCAILWTYTSVRPAHRNDIHINSPTRICRTYRYNNVSVVSH
jgi:hypothetical protein